MATAAFPLDSVFRFDGADNQRRSSTITTSQREGENFAPALDALRTAGGGALAMIARVHARTGAIDIISTRLGSCVSTGEADGILAGIAGDLQECAHFPTSGTWLSDPDRPMQHFLCIPLLRSERSSILAIIGFTGFLGEGARMQAEQGAATICALIATHVALWRRLRSERRRNAGLADALDHNEIAIFVLAADGSVGFSNAAAQEMLAAHDGLRMNSRTVAPVTLRDAVRFQMTVEHVSARCHDGKRAVVMQIDRGDNRRPLIATVMASIRPPQAASDPAAIVYVLRPEQDNSRFLAPICKLQGLSPVETRLVCGLVSGQTITEAAARMHVKADTARAYLKQIFLKTGTHRQTDLVRLMLGSLAPVAARLAPETAI